MTGTGPVAGSPALIDVPPEDGAEDEGVLGSVAGVLGAEGVEILGRLEDCAVAPPAEALVGGSESGEVEVGKGSSSESDDRSSSEVDERSSSGLEVLSPSEGRFSHATPSLSSSRLFGSEGSASNSS